MHHQPPAQAFKIADAEVLAAWERRMQYGFVQAGHLRSLGVVSRPALDELVYHAFVTAWVTACAETTRTERQRWQPLIAAYDQLYNTVWNLTATVDIDMPGYNGLSYDDTNAIDEAASAVEQLRMDYADELADLLDRDSTTTPEGHQP